MSASFKQQPSADQPEDKLNDLYLYSENKLREIEHSFMELEKEYYKLSPHFEQITGELGELHELLKKHDAPAAARRILNLKYVIYDFQNKHGYNVDGFHELFKTIRLALEKLPSEIVIKNKFEELRSITSQSVDTIKSEIEALKRSKRHDLYLACEAEGLNFLTLITEKVWQKRIEAGHKIKIQIKSLPEPNLFSFQRIFSTQPASKEKKEQEAILLKLPSGDVRGILADNTEGALLISKKLIRQKTEYLHRGDNKYEPYLQMKGQRYFIRNEI